MSDPKNVLMAIERLPFYKQMISGTQLLNHEVEQMKDLMIEYALARSDPKFRSSLRTSLEVKKKAYSISSFTTYLNSLNLGIPFEILNEKDQGRKEKESLIQSHKMDIEEKNV